MDTPHEPQSHEPQSHEAPIGVDHERAVEHNHVVVQEQLDDEVDARAQIEAAVDPALVDITSTLGNGTAAASNGVHSMATTAETTGYAIPIESALSIAAEIEAGHASPTVHIGAHGLLGVEIDGSGASGTSTGVGVLGVQANVAAARAGIVAGDAITAINGRTISTISDLDGTMAATHVGDTITIGWEDTAGQAHAATVTINAGAA